MRRSAYIKAVEQAKLLPTEVPELKRYFSDTYNPREMALRHIVNRARHDSDGLLMGELFDVVKAVNSEPRTDPTL